MRRGAGRMGRGSRSGEAAGQVIAAVVVATLALSGFLFFAALQGGGGQTGDAGGEPAGNDAPPPDPWASADLGKGSIPQRGGLDGSVDVPRLRAALTPLVSVSAGAGAAKAEPIQVGLEASVPEKAEEGAKAGYGELGGPERHVPLLGGPDAFPAAASLELGLEKLKGWGARFGRR